MINYFIKSDVFSSIFSSKILRKFFLGNPFVIGGRNSTIIFPGLITNECLDQNKPEFSATGITSVFSSL